MTLHTVTAKMYLGLVEETNEYTGGLHGMHKKMRSHIPPLGALGRMLPQDIGLRMSSNRHNVESLDTMLKRTGRSLEQHKRICIIAIQREATKYHGFDNYKGGTINKNDYAGLS